ncbi:MAG: AmmeMemoRadiSam system protein B [Alteromonadaceae bacterium]|nr:AmmeMemoRadiSam system protein B [Alteromonadaceae bacterium]
MKYRLPVVSGRFYPSSPEQLRKELADCFAKVDETDIQADICPKALIVPHAGYYYSAAVAAYAYTYLKNLTLPIDRVILLGPSHQFPLQGCAVPSQDVFVTPLGEVPVDRAACEHLLQLGLVQEQDKAHTWEHSLEVQLPFLQSTFNFFQILPITVGAVQPDEINKILQTVLNPAAALSEGISTQVNLVNTLIIVSTDLSHYHSYEEAQLLDASTAAAILRLDASLQPQDACGYCALNGFLRFCQCNDWQIKLVNQANSGDIDGLSESKKEVVGYASFIAY